MTITQDEFLSVAERRPEMKCAFQDAVEAVVKLRREAALNKRGVLASFKLKRLGVKAVFLTEQLISGFVYDGRSATEQEAERIRSWVIDAAEYRMGNPD